MLQRFGLFAGPIAAALFLLFAGPGLAGDARAVVAVAILMAVWWVSEALPVGVTALLPLVLVPLASGLSFATVSPPYASNIVFLFMGGMMLGLGLERSGLHRRIALRMLVLVGASPRRLVGAFMLVTALFSMWLSNSATTMMLAPIGLSVIQGMREDGRDDTGFAAALMLGIAYAASLGGMGTPIGTPTNLVMTGYVRSHYGLDIGMLEWMKLALPVLATMLPLAWAWLCFGAIKVSAQELPGGRALLRARLAALGSARPIEWRSGVVFLVVALCWISRPLLARVLDLPGLDDGVIALAGAVALFLIPDGEGRGGAADGLGCGARNALGYSASARWRAQSRGGDQCESRGCADGSMALGQCDSGGDHPDVRALGSYRVLRRADQQRSCRGGHHAGAGSALRRARAGPAARIHDRHSLGELRVHASRCHTTQCDRVFQRLRAYARHAARRPGTQCDGHRRHRVLDVVGCGMNEAWERSPPLRLDPHQALIDVLDQTQLPFHNRRLELGTLEDCVRAISSMVVRGAPLIGLVAAGGLAIAVSADPSDANLEGASLALIASRPTAVNLRWAVEGMRAALSPLPPALRRDAAWRHAAWLQREEHACCERIGAHGYALLREAAATGRAQSRGRLNILTHCNAGWLATGAWGTALAPVYRAWREGLPLHVWVDETRPRNQGARLTAWELREAGIPHTLLVDNAAGHLMQRRDVDLCLVGSDRTTRAGDVCNKIGTYQKALAAGDNDVPFYVALPRSTIDWSIVDGLREIPIEVRSHEEVLRMEGLDARGDIHFLAQTPIGCAASNPAFDVTPARLVSGLICEYGVFAANEQALAQLQAVPETIHAPTEPEGDFPGVVHGLS